MAKAVTLFAICYASGALTAWAAIHSTLGKPYVVEIVLAFILGLCGLVICLTAVSETV